jgi:hypothetical protein
MNARSGTVPLLCLHKAPEGLFLSASMGLREARNGHRSVESPCEPGCAKKISFDLFSDSLGVGVLGTPHYVGAWLVSCHASCEFH